MIILDKGALVRIKCPDVLGIGPSSLICWLLRVAPRYQVLSARTGASNDMKISIEATWPACPKMRRISCLFLCLSPSQSLIPRTSASAAVCPFVLKCSATGKPGALLVMLRRFHQNVPSECAQSRRCKWTGSDGRRCCKSDQRTNK